MTLTKLQKEQAITQMHADITQAVSVVFVAYDGLTVAQAGDLRDQLSAGDSHMRVMPKRLLKIVTKQAGLDFHPKDHTGQIAVIWGSDAVHPAKTLAGFVKNHEHLQLLAGSLEGNTLSLSDVEALAALPTREQLLGQLLNVLNGPVRGFASALAGVPRNLVYVIQGIADLRK